jgi:hypothetical protein
MEAKPILWEVPRYRNRPFPCFINGCQKEAGHLTKFSYGDAIVQVCLCDDCLKKSPQFILKGLRMQPENVAN